MTKQQIRKPLITIVSMMAILAIFFIDPIEQDLAYHNFIDTNKIFGVPNFWNVMSNIPFFIVGIYGLYSLKRSAIIPQMRMAYGIWFFGVAMVAFGSGYYHLSPSNETLVWDRLPMTVAFMSLFAIIISEFINVKKGKLMLLPLLVLGALSVFYWQWTESNGVGDLRFYALIQFLPIILIPIIILSYPSQYDGVKGYWYLLIFYVLAKALEFFDAQIFNLLAGGMSGHALKHVAAAIGVYMLIVSFKKRTRLDVTK